MRAAWQHVINATQAIIAAKGCGGGFNQEAIEALFGSPRYGEPTPSLYGNGALQVCMMRSITQLMNSDTTKYRYQHVKLKLWYKLYIIYTTTGSMHI